MKKKCNAPIFMTCLFVLLTLPAGAQESINSLEEITLGGVKQWILVRGEKASNPILLFLHGGPGFPQMPFTHVESNDLEKHFLVVNWDQRGAGKSFNPDIPPESMNIEQFMSDTHELIELLRTRYRKDKIFLIGHSWGTVLGLKTAYRFPELLHAYIGMGQVINMKEGEMLSYRYTVEKAREMEDVQAVGQLEKIGPPPYTDYPSLSTQRMLLAKFGGSFRKINYMTLGMYWSRSPHYTSDEKNSILNAMIKTQNIMWPQLQDVDFLKEITELKVPVYFFTGRFDYQTPWKLVERFYEGLKAPYKEIVWFEESGHVLNLEEPEFYQKMLITKVLKWNN
ncbi:alpha/beta hydrolase [bacterium]|nr:alpha/beta hydrolase [bacterium]